MLRFTTFFTIGLIYFSFISQTLAQQVDNGDFEIWQILPNYEVPAGWFSQSEEYISFFQSGNYGLKKSTDAQTGSFAVELHNVDRNNIDGVDDGYFSVLQTGFVLQDKPHRFKGYYKSDLLPGDTALLGVFVYSNGIKIGEGAYSISGVNNQFVDFEAYIGYSVAETPDSIEIIAISSTKNQNFPKEGKIVIDNIKLSFDPWSSTEQNNTQQHTQKVVNAGPNPSSGTFLIWIESPSASNYTVSMYDLLGSKVHQQSNSVNQAGRNQLIVEFPAHLSNGMYIYEVTSENFRHSNRVNLRR